MLLYSAVLYVIFLSASVDAEVIHQDNKENPSIAEMRDHFSPAAYKRQQIHAAVNVLAYGEGRDRVYIFFPEQPKLQRKTHVPVVFFHHGWQGMNPENFGAIIDHLARSGHVVVYPVYQESAATDPKSVTANAVRADLAAVAMIEKEGYQPDPNRILYVGYSIGAAISLNIAIQPDNWKLPTPKALVLMAPGDTYNVIKDADSIIGNLKKLPASLPVVIMTGAADTSIGVPVARKIMSELCGISADRRVLMILPSDQNGAKTVHSAHGSPGAPDSRYNFALADTKFPRVIQGRESFEESVSLNQLDFYGYWKMITVMDQGLVAGDLPPIVFGNGTVEQKFLGVWPDGTLYKSIQIENPCRN